MAAIAVTTTPAAATFPASTDTLLYVQNRGPSEVFFGPDSTLTAANGVGIAVGGVLEYPAGYLGSGYDLWLVTATGTADVRWVRI